MSAKEIKDAMEQGSALFGIKQAIKYFKGKKPKKSSRVFVARDARDDTIEKLDCAKIEFEVLSTKEELSKVLGLEFESEVFLIK